MSFEIAYFGEPKLQFGDYFEYEDAKTGLAEYGPFGKSIPGLHKEAIRLGFVGTRESISGAQEWVTKCAGRIQSNNVKTTSIPDMGGLFSDEEQEEMSKSRLDKMLSRDFIGFNRDSEFACTFQMNKRWDRPIHGRDITLALKGDDKAERIQKLVELFVAEIELLSKTPPAPDVIIVALTDEMVEDAERVRIYGNYYLDFRRLIKALAMRCGIPIQLLQSRTVTGKGGKRELQDEATRAWNFCTAQYYKADGVPWRPATLEANTCYIGISFYIAQEEEDGKLTLRASLAQAFDYLGQGLVLRGDPFEWDAEKLGKSPHLSYAAARNLIKDTLEEYTNFNHLPPERVVIHKSSVFWGREHPEYNELEGFQQGIMDVFPRAASDLVALRQVGIRLFREGRFPPLRGTYFCLEGQSHFLYTMGYTPYLQTYPGTYVPEPWQIVQHVGDSAPKDLLKEVLALTKMNVNNCSFADGKPITLSFSQRIGEIMKHIPEGEKAQPQYKHYM